MSEIMLSYVNCVFRNCVFQVVYVTLMLAGHVVALFDTLPFLYALEPEANHTLWLCVWAVTNCFAFQLASFSDPGVINRLNMDKYASIYSYDGVIYKPGVSCWTCNLEKIPRSKHCGWYH